MKVSAPRAGKEGKPEPIAAKISQETLAEMRGSTRTRVNLFMNKFRKLGFIEYNGDYMSGGAVKPNFWALFQFHPFFCST